MDKVFISYSRRNKNFAERLARDLSDAGLDVWIDFRQIHAGELWRQEIYRGIERSEIVVVCLSPPAVMSEWVQREVNTAREQEKFIIPVMAVDALTLLEQTESIRWLLDVQYIPFENRYEEAFPELLNALPGKRRVGAYDVVDVEKIPNPFKGLEAFQQTDAHFFFGRDTLIRKSLQRLRQDRGTRFLAVVGASGSGKSSLVRAGVLPELRGGVLPGSEQWRITIFTPGASPVDSLARRLAPLVEDRESEDLAAVLHESVEHFDVLVGQILGDAPPEARLLLVVDQFEEVFTRSGPAEREMFLDILNHAVTTKDGRALVLITMRADFFDHLSHYPRLAELFEQENMVIVTEMTPRDLLQTIEGPAAAVGLIYDEGLPQRILEEVRRQPGSLPLLQYALKELYLHREGNRLTTQAYDEIGGVQQALARHAETIYTELSAAEQAIMRRVLLQLVEVGEAGETTRRQVDRQDLKFRDVPDAAVQELIDLLTSAESRLLIASRQITSGVEEIAPKVWIEVSHEALIRQWERFTGWVADDREMLRLGTEIMQAASDWRAAERDKAYLLTGNRLIRAEAWLQEADVTDLQREFIQASLTESDRLAKIRQEQMERELILQRRATNRARGLMVFMLIALIVTAALAFWAVENRNQANRARDREQIALETAIANERLALANEQQAISLALSSSASRAMSDDERELAVLLAVYANDMEHPPPQSQRTLAEVAYTPGTRLVIDESGAEILDAAFSPDGDLALYAVGNRLVLWATETGEVIQEFQSGGEYEAGATATERCVAVSPDGMRAASAGDDGVLILWDVETGAPIRRFNGHEGHVNSIAFSPNGAYLVSGGDDDVLLLWDVETGAEIRRFTGHEDAVNGVAFSADGQLILSASDDDTVKLWQTSGALVRTFEGHTGDVTSVAFHPMNNSQFVSGSDDDTVRRWDADTGDVLRTYEQHDGNVNRVAYSPDGQSIISASSDGSLIWWATSTGQVLDTFREHGGTVFDADFSPDGAYLLSTSADGTARLWDIRQVAELRQYTGHGSGEGFSRLVIGVYSPDGNTILSGSADTTLRLWDRSTGLTVQQFLGHTGMVQDVAISADGTTALSASADQSVILWDVASGEPRLTLLGHESPVRTVSYLPGDEQAVSGAENGGLILWDLTTGEQLRRYGPVIAKGDAGHTGIVYDVAVSPDGRRMLSASADGNLLLWDIETGAVIRQYKGHNDEVRAVAFDATGDLAVSGAANGTLIVWDVSDDATVFGGVLRRIVDAHDRAVYSVAFSPDGSVVASGSQDRTLRLWDLEAGFELYRYTTANKQSFRSVTFHPDGRAMLTGLTDGTLREWRVLVSPADLITWTYANRYVRQPTCEEREQFSLRPLCVAGTPTPTPTPVPTATATPEPEAAPALAVGRAATVNTSNGDTLNVRVSPSTEVEIVAQLQDGDMVTLLEGPFTAEGYHWWYVRMVDDLQGWVVESIPAENLQTLVP